MQYLCICQKPNNSDLFKGFGLASPGGGLMDWATLEGLAEVGDKVQRWWGSKVWGNHEMVMGNQYIVVKIVLHLKNLFIFIIQHFNGVVA